MPRIDRFKAVFPLFGYPAGFALRPRGVLLVLSACVLLPVFQGALQGCAASSEADSQALSPYATQAGGVFAVEEASGGAGEGEGIVPAWWSVTVATVPSGRVDHAKSILQTVRDAGLTGAYIAVRDERPVVAFGRYADPADADAQAGLRAVRQTMIGDMSPFASAMLAPPVQIRTGSGTDEANLRTVRERFGKSRAAYTLQIGVYGRGDLGKPTAEELALFQREAEKAVRQLRAQGDEAFYYHGPNMSMLTVGILSETDHDGSTQPPIESMRLRELRRKFPNNLLNGEGIRETVRTETGTAQRLQASRLVAIPER